MNCFGCNHPLDILIAVGACCRLMSYVTLVQEKSEESYDLGYDFF
jgi:hypothetical protein